MFKRIIITMALALGILLSAAASAQADDFFTINGQPNSETYRCVAPCTIEASDPDGRSYDWDFENDGTFTAQRTGNTVSWTYTTVGRRGIIQWDGVGDAAYGTIEVVAQADAPPEDIELVSPASGSEAEFTTSRRQLVLTGCGGSPCRSGEIRTTGPVNGLYHHVVELIEAPPQAMLSVTAWNEDPSYAVRDTFAFAFVAPPEDPFTEGAAKWSTRQSGKRCVVKFTQTFDVTSSYHAKLRLRARGDGVRLRSRAKKGGGAGTAEIGGRLVFAESETTALPARVGATLKVATGGESYRVKATRVLRRGCR